MHARLFVTISHVKFITFPVIIKHSLWILICMARRLYLLSIKIRECLEMPDLFLVLNIDISGYHVHDIKTVSSMNYQVSIHNRLTHTDHIYNVCL